MKGLLTPKEQYEHYSSIQNVFGARSPLEVQAKANCSNTFREVANAFGHRWEFHSHARIRPNKISPEIESTARRKQTVKLDGAASGSFRVFVVIPREVRFTPNGICRSDQLPKISSERTQLKPLPRNRELRAFALELLSKSRAARGIKFHSFVFTVSK
ncbi:unnamed protein product, partial [Iphiclides podalirius]